MTRSQRVENPPLVQAQPAFKIYATSPMSIPSHPGTPVMTVSWVQRGAEWERAVVF
jgi:hypothetical protein